MRAKKERKQREELETPLQLLEKNLRLRKIIVFTTNVNKISKKYMKILWKEYVSKAGVSGMTKVKNPLNVS